MLLAQRRGELSHLKHRIVVGPARCGEELKLLNAHAPDVVVATAQNETTAHDFGPVQNYLPHTFNHSYRFKADRVNSCASTTAAAPRLWRLAGRPLRGGTRRDG
jgi:hypothetical protein